MVTITISMVYMNMISTISMITDIVNTTIDVITVIVNSWSAPRDDLRDAGGWRIMRRCALTTLWGCARL